MTDVKKIGRVLRSRATHHNHGEGWTYARDLRGLRYMRFDRDNKGYYALHRRLKRALSPRWLFGWGSLAAWEKGVYGSGIKRYNPVLLWIRFMVQMRKETNLPDGSINGNFVFWEEDGEYIEMVGPTIGEKIADFLEADPTNPHAVAIAEEIERVHKLSMKKALDKKVAKA